MGMGTHMGPYTYICKQIPMTENKNKALRKKQRKKKKKTKETIKGKSSRAWGKVEDQRAAWVGACVMLLSGRQCSHVLWDS